MNKLEKEQSELASILMTPVKHYKKTLDERRVELLTVSGGLVHQLNQVAAQAAKKVLDFDSVEDDDLIKLQASSLMVACAGRLHAELVNSCFDNKKSYDKNTVKQLLGELLFNVHNFGEVQVPTGEQSKEGEPTYTLVPMYDVVTQSGGFIHSLLLITGVTLSQCVRNNLDHLAVAYPDSKWTSKPATAE